MRNQLPECPRHPGASFQQKVATKSGVPLNAGNDFHAQRIRTFFALFVSWKDKSHSPVIERSDITGIRTI